MPEQTKFSLVFVDGFHTLGGVRIDSEFSYEKLANSVVTIFDDYFEPSVPDYTNEMVLLMKE